MGGISPPDAAALTLWEYQALRATWDERHNSEREPDFDRLKTIMGARGVC
jgi:hypothetical protein